MYYVRPILIIFEKQIPKYSINKDKGDDIMFNIFIPQGTVLGPFL